MALDAFEFSWREVMVKCRKSQGSTWLLRAKDKDASSGQGRELDEDLVDDFVDLPVHVGS